MSHPGPGTRSMRPDGYVWVASKKESQLHLAGASEVESGALSVGGWCAHKVRSVIGAWSGIPPHIQGYGLCAPCCVTAKIAPILSGEVVSLDEALSTALDSYRPGQHSIDRPTEVIPYVADAEVTDSFPVARPDAIGGPTSDSNRERRSDVAVPGSSYLPGAASEPTAVLVAAT